MFIWAMDKYTSSIKWKIKGAGLSIIIFVEVRKYIYRYIYMLEYPFLKRNDNRCLIRVNSQGKN